MQNIKVKIYGQTFPLLKDSPQVECWNSSKGATAIIRQGELLTIHHVYDATHATCQPVKDKRVLSDGTFGYRFIIENSILADILGIEVPLVTADPVGDILAREEGDSLETAKANFQYHSDRAKEATAVIKKLQAERKEPITT